MTEFLLNTNTINNNGMLVNADNFRTMDPAILRGPQGLRSPDAAETATLQRSLETLQAIGFFDDADFERLAVDGKMSINIFFMADSPSTAAATNFSNTIQIQWRTTNEAWIGINERHAPDGSEDLAQSLLPTILAHELLHNSRQIDVLSGRIANAFEESVIEDYARELGVPVEDFTRSLPHIIEHKLISDRVDELGVREEQYYGTSPQNHNVGGSLQKLAPATSLNSQEFQEAIARVRDQIIIDVTELEGNTALLEQGVMPMTPKDTPDIAPAPKVSQVDDGFGIKIEQVIATQEDGTVETLERYLYRGQDGKTQLIQKELYHTDPETGEKTLILKEIEHLDLEGMRIGSKIVTAYTPVAVRVLMGDDPDPLQKILATASVGTLGHVLGSSAGGVIHHSALEAHTDGSTAVDIVADSLADAPMKFLNIATNTGISLASAEITKKIYEGVSLSGFLGDLVIQGTDAAIATTLGWIAENTIGLGSASPLLVLGVPVKLGLNELVPGAKSIEGQIGSITGSLLASTALTPILGPLAPLVGTAVGHFVGIGVEEIGKWFAKNFLVTPREWSFFGFDVEEGEFVITGISTRGGTDGKMPEAMGNAFLDSINYFVEAADASAENYQDFHLPTLGQSRGRIKAFNDEPEVFATPQEAISYASLRTLSQMNALADGNMTVARVLETADISERHANGLEFAEFEWIQDAIVQLSEAEEGPINLAVQLAPGDVIVFEHDVDVSDSFDARLKKVMEGYFAKVTEAYGDRRTAEEIKTYDILFEQMPSLGTSGQLVTFGDLSGFLNHIGADFIESPDEVFADTIAKVEIAKTYNYYLENFEGINLAMRANPDSAFAAGWTVTLAQAKALGLSQTYRINAEYDSGQVFTADGADFIRVRASDVTVGTYGGHDIVVVEAGSSQVRTGTGNDLIRAEAGGNLIDGGTGIDTVDYSAAAEAVFIRLSGLANAGAAAGDRYQSIEAIVGTAFDDVFLGADGPIDVDTGAGSDFVATGSGITKTATGDEDDAVFVNGSGMHKIDLGNGTNTLIIGADKMDVEVEGFQIGTDKLVMHVENPYSGHGLLPLVLWYPLMSWMDMLRNAEESDRGTTLTRADGSTIYLDGVTLDQLTALSSTPALSLVTDYDTITEGLPHGISIHQGNVHIDGVAPAPFSGAVLETRNELSFSDAFEFVGSAASYSDNLVVLTANAPSQTGIANTIDQVDLRVDFVLEAEVHLGDADNGADGIAFTLHNDDLGPLAVGHGGGSLGAIHIQNGVSLELDTHDGGRSDPTADHVRFNDTGGNAPITDAVEVANLEDGQFHKAVLTWDAKASTLSFTLDGQVVSTLESDLVTEYLEGSPFAHIGISAATGGAMNSHAVQNVVFEGYWASDPADAATQPDFFAIRAGERLKGNLMANNGHGMDRAEDGPLTLMSIQGEPLEVVEKATSWQSPLGVSWPLTLADDQVRLDDDHANAFLPDALPMAVRLPSGAVVLYSTNGDIVIDTSDLDVPLAPGEPFDEAFTYTVVTSAGRLKEETVEISILDPIQAPVVQPQGHPAEDPNGSPLDPAVDYPGIKDTGTVIAFTEKPQDYLGGDGPDTLDAGSHSEQIDFILRKGKLLLSDGTVSALKNIEHVIGTQGSNKIDGTHDADNHLRGEGGKDFLWGRNGDDTLEGGDGNDFVMGQNGNDYVSGDNGHDKIYGHAGQDWLVGSEDGSGFDHLFGGANADRFVFHGSFEGDKDTIKDFNRQEGDQIQIVGGYTFVDLTLQAWGNGTKIWTEAGNQFAVAKNVDHESWTADDFIFV